MGCPVGKKTLGVRSDGRKFRVGTGGRVHFASVKKTRRGRMKHRANIVFAAREFRRARVRSKSFLVGPLCERVGVNFLVKDNFNFFASLYYKYTTTQNPNIESTILLNSKIFVSIGSQTQN